MLLKTWQLDHSKVLSESTRLPASAAVLDPVCVATDLVSSGLSRSTSATEPCTWHLPKRCRMPHTAKGRPGPLHAFGRRLFACSTSFVRWCSPAWARRRLSACVCSSSCTHAHRPRTMPAAGRPRRRTVASGWRWSARASASAPCGVLSITTTILTHRLGFQGLHLQSAVASHLRTASTLQFLQSKVRPVPCRCLPAPRQRIKCNVQNEGL